MNPSPSLDRLIDDGLAASRDGRTREALAAFAQAAALAPAAALPPFLIGSEHAAAGEVAAAQAAFADAVRLAPGFTLARYQLGLLQLAAGQASLALLTLQPLLSLPWQEALGHFARGLAALAQQQMPQALDHLREGLACADVPPAMTGDVRRLIDAMQHAESPRAPGDATASGGHVLLAGYARAMQAGRRQDA